MAAPSSASSISSASSSEEGRFDSAQRPAIQRTRTARQEDVYELAPTFEPIKTQQTNDDSRDAIRELNSLLTRTESYRSYQGRRDGGDEEKALERQDTIANLELTDPRLDPNKPEFDFFTWVRMFMKIQEEEGHIQRRAGFTFKHLNILGSGAALQLQPDVGSGLMAPFRYKEMFGHPPERHILRDFNGCVRRGEMLIVLGRPGSGCSTFLKSISGELFGLKKGEGSVIEYDGIPQDTFIKELKGEITYNQENEKHFPHLTVGQTLEFAAKARAPSAEARVKNIPRDTYAKHLTKVVMSVFGLGHTFNTKVGNDFVRGVSGGERKRVSLAEMALAGSPIACWDNSTRGLDAATALEFVRALRNAANVTSATQAVAIYQASQSIYDIFDKAIVLYEGRQIYFGPADDAKAYFETMGWFCPQRQTTGDFLTSITNPQERKAREGYETKVPRTPDDFERYWQQSTHYKDMLDEIEQNEKLYPEGATLAAFRDSHHQAQAKHVRAGSPYTISVPMQVKICTIRAYQRLWNDKTSTITTIIGQSVMALIIGSVFYGTPLTTAAFFSKGSVLFFAVLLNALLSITEVNSLFAQRPIVEKHVSYAFYHPFCEGLAGIVADIPIKFAIGTVFNVVLYFLSGLRTEPSQFFIFFLFNFVATLTMSAVFRTIAAATKTLSQALAIAGVMVLAIVIYTGFTLQRSYMHPWFKWLSWINPIAYAFEALLVNEMHGRRFECAALVPPYGTGKSFQCPVPGAVAGERTVSGDDWFFSAYGYSYSHIWRNLGFLFAFQIGFYALYLVATEMNSKSASTAEFLVFRRGHVPKHLEPATSDEETGKAINSDSATPVNSAENDSGKVQVLERQTDVFTWRDVTYDITIKGEPRRLLDHISGWVKPGTLTALMGVSGAGKTTLLDALAQRTTMGVITGDMLVNGRPLDLSFQRKTGYVQQQDLHLETTTVREALQFSANLRQPKTVPQQEKDDFVEDVIKMLNMEDFAEAIVGSPGEGLNVEQRKLLTIGVELAAKPALLLFLDEPTSGLDSQSSWQICAFLRKLADNGQAVLSTIHQPSAILFQEFDRLLFLAKGGKTVYFGDIGANSNTLLEYFEKGGARPCGSEENPAEYMLETVGAGATGKSSQDWPAVWRESQEAKLVQTELDRIHAEKSKEPVNDRSKEAGSGEFAMPLTAQMKEVTRRIFQQYWRTPAYIYGKLTLGVMSALFIGFSFFLQNSSSTGLQNSIFSIFMLATILSTLVQQIMPRFVIQRSLYEVRERPSKAYSWKAFLVANIVAEIPWQILLGILVWASLYFPVFGHHQNSERQALFLLYSIQFFIFASTFAQMVIAALPDAETAGNIATLLFSMMLTFNGVLQPPSALPGFWIFMYRVSPLTYTVGGLSAVGLHGRAVHCAQNELAIFDPPSGQTCQTYLADYFKAGAPGSLYNPQATSGCEYCSIQSGDQFLAGSLIYYNQRWRNFGIVWAYVLFNIAAVVMLYYFFRVRKWQGKSTKKSVSLLVHRTGRAGFWVRSLFVRHPEWTPKGKEAENNKVY